VWEREREREDEQEDGQTINRGRDTVRKMDKQKNRRKGR